MCVWPAKPDFADGARVARKSAKNSPSSNIVEPDGSVFAPTHNKLSVLTPHARVCRVGKLGKHFRLGLGT